MPGRRILALFLILVFGLSSFEAVWGEVRDGDVHHENVATAADHSMLSQGDHGHEDVGAPEHHHDEQHQHGTGADHCTHQHGVEVPALILVDLGTLAITSAAAETEYRFTSRPPSGLLRPPRA